MKSPLSTTFVAMVLLLPLVIGCGTKTRAKIVPVSGKITFADGSSLPEGTKLLFSPVEGGGQSASAITDADGNFTVQHAGGASGAEIGSYLVELRSPDGEEPDFYKKVPVEFTSQGGLSAIVSEAGTSLDLVLRMSRTYR